VSPAQSPSPAVGATVRRAAAGVLVVVSPVGEPGEAVPGRRIVGGLPLLRRIVLAATAAGYDRILVAHADHDAAELLEGTSAIALLPGVAAAPSPHPARVVILPANVVPQAAWLRALMEMPAAAGTLYVDSSLTLVVETEKPAGILAAAARCESAGALVAELRRTFAEDAWLLDPDGRFPLVTSRDVDGAETWLLRSLIKQREGFMSRHVERRISLAVTRRLAAGPITPNAMTILSAAIGLASAPFFLSASPVWQLTGALLLLTHSILDGCDGELARLKFMQSPRGAMLDYWGDNLVHVAVFTCIAIGWSLAVGAAWPLIAGAVSVAATLGSAALMFERTAHDRAPIDGVIDALASRDFVYILLVLSAFGKAPWFLAVTAVGTPIFLLFALWLDGRRGRVR